MSSFFSSSIICAWPRKIAFNLINSFCNSITSSAFYCRFFASVSRPFPILLSISTFSSSSLTFLSDFSVSSLCKIVFLRSLSKISIIFAFSSRIFNYSDTRLSTLASRQLPVSAKTLTISRSPRLPYFRSDVPAHKASLYIYIYFFYLFVDFITHSPFQT